MLGNAILLKHAELNPQTALAIEKCFHDAGVPEGVYTNLFLAIPDVEQVIAHPLVQGVTLTGSERAGSAVASLAGKHLKKSVLELGGSDPFIVLDTEDLGRTVKAATMGRMQNTGQACIAAKRLIVPEDIYEPFVEGLKQAFSTFSPGDPSDPSTSLAPAVERAGGQGPARADPGRRRQGRDRRHRRRPPRPRRAPSSSRRSSPTSPRTCGPTPRSCSARPPSSTRWRTRTRRSSWPTTPPTASAPPSSPATSTRPGRWPTGSRPAWCSINQPTGSSAELPFGGVKRSGYGRELSELGMFEFANRKLTRVLPAKKAEQAAGRLTRCDGRLRRGRTGQNGPVDPGLDDAAPLDARRRRRHAARLQVDHRAGAGARRAGRRAEPARAAAARAGHRPDGRRPARARRRDRRGRRRLAGHAAAAARARPRSTPGWPAPCCGSCRRSPRWPTGRSRFDGDPRLRDRPNAGLLAGLRALGVEIDDGGRGRAPFTVHGTGRVRGGAVEVDASESSQIVSGLLLAAARFDEGIDLSLAGGVPSMPHVEMTVTTLRAHGVEVAATDRGWRVAPGPIAARDVVIEPDLSNAAPFLAAALVTGGRVTVRDWPEVTTQPGAQLDRILTAMGAEVDPHARGPAGDRRAARSRPLVADLGEVGELTPVLAALCALADGPSRLTGVGHLRGHETDRLQALDEVLTAVGARVEQLPDGLVIEPGPRRPALLDSYADHRMVHAAAVLGLAIEGVQAGDPGAVAKTLPDFVERWAGLRRASRRGRHLSGRQYDSRSDEDDVRVRPEPPGLASPHAHPAGARRRRPRAGRRRRPRADDRARRGPRRRAGRRHHHARPRAGQARRRRRRPGADRRRHQRPHRQPRPHRHHRGADDVAAAHRRRHRPHRADRRRQRRPAGHRHRR